MNAVTFGWHDTVQPGPLLRSATSAPSAQTSILPSITFGPFHASPGGIGGTRTHLGSYGMDTARFLGSHISGGIGTQSAHFLFSVPNS